MELNNIILKLAPKHIAKSIAPDTFESVNRHIGVLTVWDGASDTSIFQDACVNHAFRAWHDRLHITMQAEFNEIGEFRIALEQARQLEQFSSYYSKLIIIEIAGQFEHSMSHGTFPINQIEFTKELLKNELTQLTNRVLSYKV